MLDHDPIPMSEKYWHQLHHRSSPGIHRETNTCIQSGGRNRRPRRSSGSSEPRVRIDQARVARVARGSRHRRAFGRPSRTLVASSSRLVIWSVTPRFRACRTDCSRWPSPPLRPRSGPRWARALLGQGVRLHDASGSIARAARRILLLSRRQSAALMLSFRRDCCRIGTPGPRCSSSSSLPPPCTGACRRS